MRKGKVTDLEKISIYKLLAKKTFSLFDETKNITQPSFLTDEMILTWCNKVDMLNNLEVAQEDDRILKEMYQRQGKEQLQNYFDYEQKYVLNTSWLFFPDLTQVTNLSLIEEALKEQTCNVHIFRSGSGLRVATIHTGKNGKGKQIGYGEHLYIEKALEHVELDLTEKGIMSYSEKYSGENSLFPHYLIGSSYASTNFDRLVLGGATIHMFYDKKKKEFVTNIKTYDQTNIPEDIQENCLENKQSSFCFLEEETGITYECTAYQFANREWGIKSKCKFVPEGMLEKAYMRPVNRKGTSKETLWQSIFNAILNKGTMIDD